MAYMKKGSWLPNEDDTGLTYVDTFENFSTIEAGRYHLYVSLACPFAHRPLLVHSLMGLENVISVSSVAPKRYECGWAFDEEFSDPILKTSHLQDIYKAATPEYTGRISVPVLWDKKLNTIASNDSGAIADWFHHEWKKLARTPIQLNGLDDLGALNELNEWIHEHINTAVYKAGFSEVQAEYDDAFSQVFSALNEMEERLSKTRYLFGNTISMSDIRLIASLVRFDSVYFTHFKLNKKRLQDYPNLWNYTLDLMSQEAIRRTVNHDYIKLHYYFSHDFINPHRIVPKGMDINWSESHDRKNRFN